MEGGNAFLGENHTAERKKGKGERGGEGREKEEGMWMRERKGRKEREVEPRDDEGTIYPPYPTLPTLLYSPYLSTSSLASERVLPEL